MLQIKNDLVFKLYVFTVLYLFSTPAALDYWEYLQLPIDL